MLAEANRDRLVRRGEGLGQTLDTALAFNDPKRLKDRVREHEDALGLRETAEEAVSRSSNLLALVEEANAHARRQAIALGETMETEPGGME